MLNGCVFVNYISGIDINGYSIFEYYISQLKRNNYYSINKKLIIDLSQQKLKPGVDKMVQSIFIKKNFKKILPKLSDLKNIYKIMEKLDH